MRPVLQFQDSVAGNELDRYSSDVRMVDVNRAVEPFLKEKDPRKFISDAVFVRPRREWAKSTGLGLDVNRLPALFNSAHDSDQVETLVKSDVERIAREIREFYEAYGNYSDAGDCHIAEMEYRRVQAKGFTRVVLTLYNWVSRYGELPTRALWWLLGVLAAPALLYPFTGFRFQGVETRLLLRFEWSNFGPTVVSLLKAILFSLAGLVSGYFRIQSEMLGSASA